MNDAFRHLQMPAEFAGECLTVLSRVEYALKATYLRKRGQIHCVMGQIMRIKLTKLSDKFVDQELTTTVDNLLANPPHK